MGLIGNKKALKDYLERERVEYRELDHDIIKFTDEGGHSGLRDCEVFCAVADDVILAYAYCPLKGDEDCQARLLEYFARVNYDLRVGNFEYDVRDGEIRYKTTLITGGEIPTPDQLEELLAAAVTTLHMFGDGIIRLIFDPEVNPLECVEASWEQEEERRRQREEEEAALQSAGEEEADAPTPVDFSALNSEQREQCAQLLCRQLMRRIGMADEEEEEEAETEDS